MNSVQIQRIIDQLLYNQLYAPHYPAEDRTDLPRQESLIGQMIAEIIASEKKADDTIAWLKLAERSIASAFESYRDQNEDNASKNIDSAVEYIRNASLRKKIKPNFAAKPDGTVEHL